MVQKLRKGSTFFPFTKTNNLQKETGVYITALITEKVKASQKMNGCKLMTKG